MPPGGSPSDIDAADGVLGVLYRSAGKANLMLFTYNNFGELRVHGGSIALGAAAANGVAIMPPADDDDR